jgi:hypothetical protein
MMARTQTEFQESLDADFAWRRKELSAIRASLGSVTEVERGSPLLRAGTALLYAHWEGFIKFASDAYVEYVGHRRLQYNDLDNGFLALALRKKLEAFASSENASNHIEFIEFLMGDLRSHAKLPKLGVIKVGNNLNSARLKVIFRTIGLDYSTFELKENLIDNQLLGWRNEIAHGQRFCPKLDEFETLYQETTGMLRNFKDQVSNAISMQAYRRKPGNSPKTKP